MNGYQGSLAARREGKRALDEEKKAEHDRGDRQLWRMEGAAGGGDLEVVGRVHVHGLDEVE